MRRWWLRFRFRVWRPIRARLVPWCNEPGCWSRTHAYDGGHRINACSTHAWRRIQRALDEAKP